MGTGAGRSTGTGTRSDPCGDRDRWKLKGLCPQGTLGLRAEEPGFGPRHSRVPGVFNNQLSEVDKKRALIC